MTRELIFIASILLNGCGASAGDPVTDGKDENPQVGVVPNKGFIAETVPSIKCDNGSYLTYQNFGKSFVDEHCISCHSSSLEEGNRANAPTTINLDSYEQILIYRGKIISQSTKTKKPNKMPPDYRVNSTELSFWREWLLCGAQEK